jgi:hypothetical protein
MRWNWLHLATTRRNTAKIKRLNPGADFSLFR